MNDPISNKISAINRYPHLELAAIYKTAQSATLCLMPGQHRERLRNVLSVFEKLAKLHPLVGKTVELKTVVG